MVLNSSKEPLSTTQISQQIGAQTKGKIFKVSGALRNSLENRLRKLGYVDGKDIPNKKTGHKPVRMTLYSITAKGQALLNWGIVVIKAID